MLVICASRKLDMDEKIRRWHARLDELLKDCFLEPARPKCEARTNDIRALSYALSGVREVYDTLGLDWPLGDFNENI